MGSFDKIMSLLANMSQYGIQLPSLWGGFDFAKCISFVDLWDYLSTCRIRPTKWLYESKIQCFLSCFLLFSLSSPLIDFSQMVCILCLTLLEFIGIINFFFFLFVRCQEVQNHGNQLDNCHGVLNYDDKSLLTTQSHLCYAACFH